MMFEQHNNRRHDQNDIDTLNAFSDDISEDTINQLIATLDGEPKQECASELPVLTDSAILDWIEKEAETIPVEEQEIPRIVIQFYCGELMYMLLAGENICQRRVSDNFVNLTRLMGILKVPRGSRDHIIRTIQNRQVIKSGPSNLRGTWAPLEEARKVYDRLSQQFCSQDQQMTSYLAQLLSDDVILFLDGPSLLKICAKEP